LTADRDRRATVVVPKTESVVPFEERFKKYEHFKCYEKTFN
jgi:hypothetical protein